ncbi:MAG: AAA family ATPase [Rhodoferax sp.]|uniref:ExeA family protein n=1 Tax=Rhodoferax sp. TaxID=50421 RepID=UPI00261251DF|nr:ExeA family protein [Rhodoferax sp.]MDD5333138.1 AAA family ATPase [Rhodoferax sp.]
MSSSALASRLGLHRNPFPPTPDALSFFLTPHLEREYAEVRHCIKAQKGVVVVMGEVGLGKSTLIRHLLDDLGTENTVSALILNTFLQGEALLDAILRDFGLSVGQGVDGGLACLNQFLIQQARFGKLCVLIVDDAQNLTEASLELVRLLSNLETGQQKLLQILLAGQPELLEILKRRSMRQLHSRIVKHAVLMGLAKTDVLRYFEFRITAAGANGRISLDPSAAHVLYGGTHGNLRRMHHVLDRCLYGLAALNKSVIDSSLMRAALRDMDIPAITQPALTQRRPGAKRLLVISLLVGIPMLAAAAYMTAQTTAVVTLPVVRQAEVALPVASSAPLVSANSSARSDCLTQLSQRWPDLVITLRTLPARLGLVALDAPHTCIFEESGARWITWASPASASETYAFDQVSEATRQLQQRLVDLDLLAQDEVDGYLGARTQRSLREFQTSHGIPVTGIPDEFTRMLLENINATLARNTTRR